MTVQEKEELWTLISGVLNTVSDAKSKVEGQRVSARKVRTVCGRYKNELKLHGWNGTPSDRVCRVEHVERDVPTTLRDVRIKLGLIVPRVIKRVAA